MSVVTRAVAAATGGGDPLRRTPPTPAQQKRRRATLLQLSWRAAFDPGATGRLVRACGGSMAAVADQPPGWIDGRLRRRPHRDESEAPARRAMPATAPAPGHAVLTWIDDAYPSRLRHLDDAPPALFVRGDLSLLERVARGPLVAIVGARAPSAYGLAMTGQIATGLVRAGVGVISGLALGIDGAAHRAAVAALPAVATTTEPSAAAAGASCPNDTDSVPPLIAVLGCGVDVVHPRSNARLFGDVVGRGLLLSEYWWDLPAAAWRFPARNRIIAALADAVVIVEGRAQSGARHTADFALQLGIDVFAVPGEAGRRLAELPNALLRDGAGFCESADDVLVALAAAGRLPAARDPEAPGAASVPLWWEAGSVEGLVCEALADCGRSIDELIALSGRPAAAVLGCLSRLEIDGLVVAGAGQSYRLAAGVAGGPRRAAEVTP